VHHRDSRGFALVFDQWQRAEGQTSVARAASSREDAARKDAVRLSAAAVLDLGISLCERGMIRKASTNWPVPSCSRGTPATPSLRNRRTQPHRLGSRVFCSGTDPQSSGHLLATQYSPDGQTLVTAGNDGTIRARDAITGQTGLDFPLASIGRYARSNDARRPRHAGRCCQRSWRTADLAALEFGERPFSCKPDQHALACATFVIQPDSQAFLAIGDKAVLVGKIDPFQIATSPLEPVVSSRPPCSRAKAASPSLPRKHLVV